MKADDTTADLSNIQTVIDCVGCTTMEPLQRCWYHVVMNQHVLVGANAMFG